MTSGKGGGKGGRFSIGDRVRLRGGGGIWNGQDGSVEAVYVGRVGRRKAMMLGIRLDGPGVRRVPVPVEAAAVMLERLVDAGAA